MTGKGPVYVAGLERTGTSLMYALLASHPGIAMTRRTNLWTYFYDQFGDLGETANLERCLETMRRYKRLAVLHLDFDRLRREFEGGEPTYGRLFDLLERQVADRLDKPRWGDKSLHTERYADAIFDAFPDARILHMVRDPRDRYASVIARWKTRRGGVGAGTAEWLSSIRLAESAVRRYPEKYMVVRYEDLTAAPEETLRMICAFIGEDYAPEMLAMEGGGTFVEQGGNSSYGRGEATEITTRSIGRYRKVLSSREVAFIQLAAGEKMSRCGYALDEVLSSPSERTRFLLVDVPFETLRSRAWLAREKFRNRTGRDLPAYRIVDPEPAR